MYVETKQCVTAKEKQASFMDGWLVRDSSVDDIADGLNLYFEISMHSSVIREHRLDSAPLHFS